MTDRDIKLTYAEVRDKILYLAAEFPDRKTSCSYSSGCIIGTILAEKMTEEQWHELTTVWDGTCIDSMSFSGDDPPETFRIVTDHSKTDRLMQFAQSEQDAHRSWGAVGRTVEYHFSDVVPE